MLRIHFTDVDLARTRLAAAPDPLSEISASLHRLQSRRGRWAFAGWYRTTRQQLREKGLERVLRSVLLPLYPRAAYFPDFLTPVGAVDGLDVGLESILATPSQRVMEEMAILDRTSGAPAWAWQLAGLEARKEFVGMLRAYYDVVVAPHKEQVQTRIEAERAARCRGFLDGGVEGMLAGLGPMLRWRPPVLEVAYPKQVDDRDLHLNGRGLTLVPSYFNWGEPVAFADPGLPPVLWYSLLHEPEARPVSPGAPEGSLTNLLGRARAVALRTASAGATTGEIARAAGVSASAASRHATTLRDAGLITTVRNGPTVLHTLTPTGASLLRAALRKADADVTGTLGRADGPARDEPESRDHVRQQLADAELDFGETRTEVLAHGRRASTWASAYDFHHRQAEATPASPTPAGGPASRLRPAECRALLMLAAISRMTGEMTAAEHQHRRRTPPPTGDRLSAGTRAAVTDLGQGVEQIWLCRYGQVCGPTRPSTTRPASHLSLAFCRALFASAWDLEPKVSSTVHGGAVSGDLPRIRWERRADMHEAFLKLACCLITHRQLGSLC